MARVQDAVQGGILVFDRNYWARRLLSELDPRQFSRLRMALVSAGISGLVRAVTSMLTRSSPVLMSDAASLLTVAWVGSPPGGLLNASRAAVRFTWRSPPRRGRGVGGRGERPLAAGRALPAQQQRRCAPWQPRRGCPVSPLR